MILEGLRGYRGLVGRFAPSPGAAKGWSGCITVKNISSLPQLIDGPTGT